MVENRVYLKDFLQKLKTDIANFILTDIQL